MASDLGRPAGSHPTVRPAGGEGEPATGAAGGPERGGEDRSPSVRRRRLAILGVSAGVVGADQATKTWALHHAQDPVHVVGTLRLSLEFNSGTAFGLGQNSTAIIVAAVVVLVVVLLGLGRRASRTATWPAALAMGLLLGGALGNLTARLVRHHHGAVIDFIDPQWFPVFNLADAAVSVGVVLALAHNLLTTKRLTNQHPPLP